MDGAPKLLVIEGGDGGFTVTDAVAAGAGLASFEVSVEVVLFWVPVAVPVTLTWNVQGVLAASCPPERLMLVAPGFAVTPPLHDPVTMLGVETTSPEGSPSVNARPLSDNVVSLLVIVNVSVVLAPTTMAVGLNAFVNVGVAACAKARSAVPPITPSAAIDNATRRNTSRGTSERRMVVQMRPKGIAPGRSSGRRQHIPTAQVINAIRLAQPSGESARAN
jgi:hypothetical protein